MTTSRHVIAVVEEVLDHPAAARGELLDRRFAADPAGLAEARALLSACLRDDSFLETPLPVRPAGLEEGAVLGSFRIVRHLASGGMGDVYEAEQTDPRRRVAVKLMRFGLRSAEALQRFRYEVAVLGKLTHPAIATIYEAGMHRVGDVDVPYFAMEFIEGARSLSRYADEEGLDPAARVALFRQVCEGVQYGHRFGVVHRDLKPANILVGEDGRPRIIDYGIARSLDVDDGHRTLTVAGELIGTVGYMSPDQLEDPQKVDTRTDVYALGVVLYELLAGRPPFDLHDMPLSKALRTVIEEEPPRLRNVAPALPRELDWIVGRAMEKDPARRYAGADSLEADLRRFAANEAVEAVPPTRLYRLRKLVRRNRALFAVGALLVLSLIGAVVGTSLGLAEAREQTTIAQSALKDANHARAIEQQQRQIAEREAQRQQAAFATLLQTLGAIHPEQRGREVTVYEALEQTRGRAEKTFAHDPELLALLQVMLAGVYSNLDEMDVAEELASKAERTFAASDTANAGHDRMRARTVLAEVASSRGQWDEAERMATELLEASGGDATGIGIQARFLLADVARRRGQYDKALARYRKLVSLAGLSDMDAVLARSSAATCLRELGDYTAGAKIGSEAMKLAEESYPESHPVRVLAVYGYLLNAVKLGGDRAEQVRELEQLLELVQHAIGPESDTAVAIHRSLGPAYAWARRPEEGERHLREAVRIATARHGETHHLTTAAVSDLAECLAFEKKTDEAEKLMRSVLEVREKAGLGHHRNQARLLENLGVMLLRAGRLEDARVALVQEVSLLDDLYESPHLMRGQARVWLGKVLWVMHRFDEAEGMGRTALEELAPFDSEQALTYRRRAEIVLSQVCASTGRMQEAKEHEAAAEQVQGELTARRQAAEAAAGADKR